MLNASLSLDLDNKWSYMKTHGDAGWDEYPSYVDQLIPKTLELFNELDLRMTFFIVGLDATKDKNKPYLAMIKDAGHEVGNHSFKHEPWLHTYSEAEIREELSRAQDAIEDATGVRPRGFRGPGFSCSQTVLEQLLDLGYDYDASTFPTYLGPLARAFYFMTAKLSDSDKEKRDALFGGLSDGMRPNKPYRWQLSRGQLVELPVTTFPVVKTPFHLSYVLYLSKFSATAATTYFASAMRACRLAGVEPSLLLHPLDFLGADEVDGLDFFPAMDLPGALKRQRVAEYLRVMGRSFNILPVGEHVSYIARNELPVRSPDFAASTETAPSDYSPKSV